MCRYQLQEGKTESFRTLHKALSEAEFSLLTHTEREELYALPSSLSPLAKSERYRKLAKRIKHL